MASGSRNAAGFRVVASGDTLDPSRFREFATALNAILSPSHDVRVLLVPKQKIQDGDRGKAAHGFFGLHRRKPTIWLAAGRRVPWSIALATFAHEAGHYEQWRHDPENWDHEDESVAVVAEKLILSIAENVLWFRRFAKQSAGQGSQGSQGSQGDRGGRSGRREVGDGE